MRYLISAVLLSALMLSGCNGSGRPVGTSEGSGVEAGDAIELQGAGATFPFPLYSKWMDQFQKEDPMIRINYQSIGSGGGIRQILENTVDFGATDAAMSDEELAKAPGKLLHVPMTLGAVVVACNLPGIEHLKLTPEVLAAVFLGEISSWNDAGIADLNPEVTLPDRKITLVYRSDGSGTTAIFTEYLSEISPEWKSRVGAGKSVRFPVGLGAKGNEGVAGQIKTSPGSLGYVELAYARQTGLSFASLRNRDGNFVEPTLRGISAAAAGVVLPEDMRMSLVNAAGPNTYPISAFTYILVYREQASRDKGEALARFLWWAVHDGQAFGAPLHYAPLPQAVVKKVEEELQSLTHDGKALLAGRQ